MQWNISHECSIYAAVNTEQWTAFLNLFVISKEIGHYEHWFESCFPAKKVRSVSFFVHEFHNQKLRCTFTCKMHFYTVDILKLCHWNTQRALLNANAECTYYVILCENNKNRQFLLAASKTFSSSFFFLNKNKYSHKNHRNRMQSSKNENNYLRYDRIRTQWEEKRMKL